MKRMAFAFLVIVLGCGGGGGKDASSLPEAECTKNEDCDDGVACTEDICAPSVGGVLRCSHVPHNERCKASEECVPTVGCRPIGGD